MGNIKQILEFAMRMEKDAEDFYEFYSEKAVSEETKKLFTELAKIEKQHFNILKEKFDQLGYSEPLLIISWVVDDKNKAIDPHILADNSDTYAAELDTQTTDISIIRMAYLIETDFKHFYVKAAESIETPNVKEFFLELAKWEMQHSQLFYKKYMALLEKSWKDMKMFFE